MIPMYLIINNNFTEIDINLTNDINTPEQFGNTNEMVSTPSYTTKHMPKPRIIDPVWGFIDEISKMSRRKLCYKEYSKETGSTTIKEHFKRDHSNAEFLKANPIEPYGKKMKKMLCF
ncbi:hypothetical protein RclHR1_00250023 [Rhizophagus clarus]|uniref:BED-type domain-containing protein n=1 Tax=Rhizophagus clarus TaxID=94130 RepID=A0A2Z6R001_9GLOM|nr:hypothetical protein RclHR1_00250023 [Rhizophagus clarus]